MGDLLQVSSALDLVDDASDQLVLLQLRCHSEHIDDLLHDLFQQLFMRFEVAETELEQVLVA